ncbi:hypothetical protein [Streptomyces sp. NRRL S-1868]|uniref:hypothetical protein n=1 Tax=Streptomyces sp. NRRL S-1868 TaxID=1463892 RepID=UPI0004C90604|nr:hypothetical protein [Streptomyces sp. NRRL S-1868]
MVPLTKQPVSRPKRSASAGRYVARAELVLARQDHLALSDMPLDPDPLQLVASALAQVRSGDGERVEVAVDLLPVDGGRLDRRRRGLLRRAERRGPQAFGERLSGTAGGGGGWWSEVVDALDGGRGGRRAGRVPRMTDLSQGVGKFGPGGAVFEVQVLVRVVAAHPGRARARLHQVLAALAVGRASNWWRAVGGRGPWRPYANAWWRRGRFDRRWASGEFAPARRRQWVTVAEIAGWLKPPTVRCQASNVRRVGGVVPPAPAQLPTWRGQRGVVPLGLVTGADGEQRLAAAPASDVLFSASFGRSGFGKTEKALLEFLTLVYGGDGGWFLDPHGAALARARPYLTHPSVRKRLWEVDLSAARGGDRMATMNPLSMEGRSADDLMEVIGLVVGAVTAAQGWGDGAPRATSILSHAAQALATLSWHMCQQGRPDLQPTLFQISTLLTDEEWREPIIDLLPEPQQRWWQATFPKYANDSVPVVTQLMDRLETSRGARAFFGSPRSTYSARQAMDTRRIVLVRPTGTGGADRLTTALLLFDLFAAGLSREGADPASMATLWAWADELTAVDGAARGAIAAILEQLRKYEVRLCALTQMVMRLSEETRQALLQNQSLVSACGADADEAAFLTRRLPQINAETLMSAPKYEYVVSTMLHGRRTAPFRVRGVPVDEVLADYYDPAGLEEQRRAVDRSMARRTVAEILTELDALDGAITDFLHHSPAGTGTGPRRVAHRMQEA